MAVRLRVDVDGRLLYCLLRYISLLDSRRGRDEAQRVPEICGGSRSHNFCDNNLLEADGRHGEGHGGDHYEGDG